MTDIYGFEPDNQDSQEWEINIDSPEIDYLKQKNSRIPDDEFSNIVNTACNLLSRCPNPRGLPAKRTGLAIGRVQSGKTLSFTTLIGLAAANGYRIIVVLAGTKKPLMNQTYKRLKTDLGIMLPGTTSHFFIESNPRMHLIDGLINALQSDKCLMLVVLKHQRHIDMLTTVISNLPPNAVLIIDDEGDEASLNTLFRGNEQSAIYRSIVALRNSLSRQPHAYIAYTATPQANLLISAVDLLSPDFCELIDPGRGYCGARVFFGENRGNYIRPIDDIDEDAVDGGMIPNSLKSAIAFFYVSAVVRHLRSDHKHSMLIHMNVRTDSHRRVYDSVCSLLDNWKCVIDISRTSDPSRQELMQLFRKAYEDLIKTVANPPEWDLVESRLAKELRSTQPFMVNSLPDGIQLAEDSFQLDNNIIIGGNILGRGLTIPNLAVSYMTRRSRGTTNADTMEQRARWFGYKMNYLDLCRIYVTERVSSDYEVLREHEDDFWESLRNDFSQGISIKDWRRLFILDDSTLRPTRAMVARYTVFQPRGWRTQNYPIRNQSIVQKNIQHINTFFSSHSAQILRVDNKEHLVVRDCPVQQVVELLASISVDGTRWESYYYRKYLERLKMLNRLAGLDVIYMSKGEDRVRSIEDDGSINQLMQGPSGNFPGDANFHNGVPQLQIHYVACKVSGKVEFYTTALALYIPKDDRYSLSFIVRDDG